MHGTEVLFCDLPLSHLRHPDRRRLVCGWLQVGAQLAGTRAALDATLAVDARLRSELEAAQRARFTLVAQMAGLYAARYSAAAAACRVSSWNCLCLGPQKKRKRDEERPHRYSRAFLSRPS